MRDLLTGLGTALTVAVLGLLAIKGGISSASAADSARDLGFLLTLLFGISSAVWWHQSATLANELVDQEKPDGQRQKDSNTLSGAAATLTALALIASVFTSLPWLSVESWLCALGLLLVIAMSGDDIRQAARISLREGLTPRSIFGFSVIGALFLAFIWHRLTE